MTDRALTEAERYRMRYAITNSSMSYDDVVLTGRLLAEYAALLAVARAAAPLEQGSLGDFEYFARRHRLRNALAALPPGLLTTENGDG